MPVYPTTRSPRQIWVPGQLMPSEEAMVTHLRILSLILALSALHATTCASVDAKPASKAAEPPAKVEQLVGVWQCVATQMLANVQMRFETKQEYSRDGSSISQSVAILSGSSAEFRYNIGGTGTWKVRGRDLCETIGRSKVTAGNQLAATPKGQQVMFALQASLDDVSQKGTSSCGRLIKLEPMAFAQQSQADKSIITNCTR